MLSSYPPPYPFNLTKNSFPPSQFRIIFRIIEFSAGADSTIHATLDNNEWYMYVFDEAPMFLALAVFNAYHPGRVLAGPGSEFPTRREEKE